MNMQPADWNTIRGAIGAILTELNDPDHVSLAVPVIGLASVKDIKLYMQGVLFEVEIGNTLAFTFGALQNAAADLVKAHELAAAVVVPNPNTVNAAQIKTDLAGVHDSVQADERFEGGIALAGDIVGIMNGMKL